MSQQTLPGCAARLTSDDLSAWRDETLPADEAARIGAHSAGCPACQQRLRRFETVAAALHAQQVPIPDARLWQSVLATISTSEQQRTGSAITREMTVPDQPDEANLQPPSAPPPPPSWRRRALGTLAAVAAIALVVVGFGRLFQSGAGTRQSSFRVSWRQVTLPAGQGANLSAGASLSVFPANGSIAWLCQSGTPDAPGPLRLWRTNDGGKSWATIPVKLLAQTYTTPSFDCQVSLDQLNPDVVIIEAQSYAHISTNLARPAYLSTDDGGSHWQINVFRLPIPEFATLHGKTYALLQDGTNDYRLAMGDANAIQNGWTYLDNPLIGQKLGAVQFWINPTTGGLLVEAHSRVDSAVASLWTADASGANWRQLDAPALGDISASPTADGRAWTICSLAAGTGSDLQHLDYRSHVLCATTTSSNWTTRSGLDIARWGNATPTACAGCVSVPNNDPYGVIQLIGIANDGALLATIEDRFDAKGQATQVGLYRLPAGSSRWQSGGALPVDGATYAPRPGGGMLWSMPAFSDSPRASGPFYTAGYSGPSALPLPSAQQTVAPTGNVDQGAPLAWRPIASPTGFQPQRTTTNMLAIAPSDGRTAYACAQPHLDLPATTPLVWGTHDGGATWSSLAAPPVSGWCSLVVNQANPRDVLLGVSTDPPMSNASPAHLYYYRSGDGGLTWRHVTGLDNSLVSQFATYGSAVYALRLDQAFSTQATEALEISDDAMATWQSIAQMCVGQFWLNPINGELLATNAAPGANGAIVSDGSPAHIWRSSDAGNHWNDLQAPQFGVTNVFVQPPQPNRAWDVCVANFEAQPGSGATNTPYCGDDSGQGWHTIPALDTGSATAPLPIYTACASDGAVLALSPVVSSGGGSAYSLYRLAPDADRWQELGATPELSLLYAPTTGSDGMLWSVPVNGVTTDTQGRVFSVAAP